MNIKLEFGDWGTDVGRIAILLAPMTLCGITVPAGVMSDGASVPRYLWWFLPPWGDAATPAAILHDFACDELAAGMPLSDGQSRAACDALFRKALLALGIAPWRAWLCWAGVRAYSLLFIRG